MSKKKKTVVPKTLEEAFRILDEITDEDLKKAIVDGDDAHHYDLGLWIRNEWFYDADNAALLADLDRAERVNDGMPPLQEPSDRPILYTGTADMFSESVINLYRGHLIKFAFDMDYDENVLHIFGIPDDIDIEVLCDDAGKYCSDNGFSGQIRTFQTEEQHDRCEEGVDILSAVLLGASTQGVEISYFRHSEGAHMHLRLPWLASPGDVKLAFALMEQIREQWPDAGIFINDDIDEGQFSLAQENFDAMVQMQLGNMYSLLESCKEGNHPFVEGFQYGFVVPCQEDYPEKDLDELTIDCMNTFIALQWKYLNIFRASKCMTETPEGKKIEMRILTNAKDTFVGTCEQLAISVNDNERIKFVTPLAFFRVMDGSPYFEKVDTLQFVLRKMPENEWEKVFDAVEGTVIS